MNRKNFGCSEFGINCAKIILANRQCNPHLNQPLLTLA
jgi:hypothetical protein